MIDRIMFGRRIIVGYNDEKTLRFGKKRESGFTAYGAWPLLIGIGNSRSPKATEGSHTKCL